jgi:EAL domain-containing protein (putative c-di-GMP-specific phosphodiesterase class I)/CheY-like chemotaxis protein
MAGEALRVLVLEDDGFQRRFAVRLLAECGVSKVFEAASGDEALAAVRARAMDVLVCDLQTPGMDGVEFIRHVAEEQLAGSIIIASGLEPALISTVEQMASAHGLQVLGAIEKPLTKDKLQTLLRQYRPSQLKVPDVVELMSLDEIAQGIEGDEFLPYFQPKVFIGTRRLVGTEALIRWRHPERGLVPPNAFIQVAEHTPLINELTAIMLDKSLAQCRVWLDQGWPISVSINFSADVLSEVGVADHVAARTLAHGLEPAQVIVEVTESMVASNAAHMLGTLARLRMKGFGLSIDDYGTGYSSLQQLSRIPFTELKIDRSLVDGAHEKASLRTLLESSLELAHKLKLKSVAEGVETEQDWNLLKELGCDIAQGYLVAKPLPAGEVKDWYGKWIA